MQKVIYDMAVTVAVVLLEVCVCGVLVSARDALDRWMGKMSEELRSKNAMQAASFCDITKRTLDNLIYTSVCAMEQTKASEIRKKVKDGALDRTALLNLGNEVLDQVKAQITPDMKKCLNTYIADLDQYLTNEMESCVRELKQSDGRAVLNRMLSFSDNDKTSDYAAQVEPEETVKESDA